MTCSFVCLNQLIQHKRLNIKPLGFEFINNINKFVITENNANMTDSEIRDVLSEHTNDLTIFLRRDYNICPDCGEEIYYLHEDSTCTYCREGKFTIESENVFD